MQELRPEREEPTVCHSHHQRRHRSSRSTTGAAVSVTAAASAPRDPAARVGDAERDATTDLLADAAAVGYLGHDEVDERLTAALTARTHADLDALTVDLPPSWLAARARRGAGVRATQVARAGLRRHVAAYAAVIALCIGIWLVVGLTAGAWYPWPVWPALGWGIAVYGQARAAGVSLPGPRRAVPAA